VGDFMQMEDPHTKANLLIQHQLRSDIDMFIIITTYNRITAKYNSDFLSHSQLPLPISDYYTDLKSVLDQAIRVIQAMVDVAGEFRAICS
tara:strand:- start:545 stop:814 length:270 start_codon:yes stop_codon:yes gene_type:complete